MFYLSGRDLSLQFGDKILFKELDFQVKPGQRWAITGRSGAGKSSLIKILTGELQSPHGTVERTSNFGEVPQGLALALQLTAYENLLTGNLKSSHWIETLMGLKDSPQHQAKALAEVFKLENVLNQKTELLSGGEQQRVSIARALLQNPPLVIADEPVSMLDAAMADEVLRVLSAKTWVCVLHQNELVKKYATHVLNLDSQHKNGWRIES